MFEYNNDKILRMLELEEFDLDKINLNEINHVHMHHYRIASKEKPLLFIENLQVCFCLYAYSKNFGFAAHINPVVIRGDEFQCDENKNIVYCNRISDLYKSIINANITDTVYIGISIGFNPIEKTYQQVYILNNNIDNLILKLNELGIKAIKLNIRNNHIFILDSECEKIITPMNQNTKQLVKIM